jgi:dolichyl-phosphate-mannose--protein O-mannosyl transferase
MKKFVTTWHHLILISIIAFAFFTRIIRLDVPERYIFDEVYHTVTARLMAADDPRAFEWWNPPPEKNTAVDWLHPPLAKYTQAFFIASFGDTSFSWRLSSALFGVGVIWLIYKLASEVFSNKQIGLLAAFLASLDGLLLVQSRITMNDIHVTFFILLSLLTYWKYRQHGKTIEWKPGTLKRLLLVGFTAGLALASKWSGLFAVAIIGLFETYDLLQFFYNKFQHKKKNWKEIIGAISKTKSALFVGLIVVPLLVYIAAYGQMFLQGKTLFCFEKTATQGKCYFERIIINDNTVWEGYISHFAMLHRQIWWYQTHLTATHTYQSRPEQWFLNLRPVWFHVDYGTNSETVANIYAFGNTALFLLGAIAAIFTALYLLLQHQKSIKKSLIKINKKHFFALTFMLVSYGFVWLPWVISPRIMFFYHYTPAVPLLSIILAFWLYHMLLSKQQAVRMLAQFSIASIIVFFIIWFPLWTAIPVPKEFANNVYFALKSWK